MRLALQFGLAEPIREINWWQPVSSFYPLVLYKGKKYEFVTWDEDLTKKVDYICVFAEVRSFDPTWYATTYENIDNLLGLGAGGCECGAIYTSFPQFHMFFCPRWSKWR